MISEEKFLSSVKENAAGVVAYQLGHDGKDGTCDCIGLIIGALRLTGFRWPGTHGTNWAARNAMAASGLCTITADNAFPGEIVYKARGPNDSGYSLPNQYENSGDLLDYYHVGVVTSVHPLEITHCTSVGGKGGIYRDTKIGNWRFGGELKYVDYSEENDMSEEPLFIAIVKAKTGNTVNMRSGPGVKYDILERIPVGSEVEVNEVLGDFCKITYNGKAGYMASEFLKEKGDDKDALHEILSLLISAAEKLQYYMETKG